MQYKFIPNLQTMAMVNKAVSLWNKSHIEIKVRCFFEHELEPIIYKTSPESRLKWENLTKEVIDSLETKIVLPQILQSHLINIIRSIGSKIYNWYVFIGKMLRDNYYDYNKVNIYTDKICWTWYGCIDEVKIFESFWLLYPQINDCYVYQMACKYCLEEYIKKLPVQEQHSTHSLRLGTQLEELDQLNYPMKKLLLEDLEPLDSYFKNVKTGDVNSTTVEIMFKTVLRQGNKFAVKYFWDKLNENEKSKHIETSLHLAMEDFKLYWSLKTGSSYKTEQYIEICIFLINKMSDIQRNNLFSQKTPSLYLTFLSLLKMILSTWPWQQFFIPTLEEMWSYLKEPDYKYLLYEIINKIKEDYEMGYAVENNIYQRILHEMWNKTPDKLKQSIPYDVIFKLVSISDYSSVNLITNDQYLSVKSLNKEYMIYIESIKKDNHDVIDNMIKTKILGGENQNVIDKMDLIDRLIKYYQYDLAEKLLDWHSSSEEERRNFKYLDPIIMYRYFILTKKHKMADRILEWRFNILPSKWLCFEKKE